MFQTSRAPAAALLVSICVFFSCGTPAGGDDPGPNAGHDAGPTMDRDGGGDDGCGQLPCAPGCSGATPVCDEASGSCVVCTATSGCSGATPIC
ncbi:MAG: hypothetical protein ACK4N5_03205, partial [Myxococcales bacterium]